MEAHKKKWAVKKELAAKEAAVAAREAALKAAREARLQLQGQEKQRDPVLKGQSQKERQHSRLDAEAGCCSDTRGNAKLVKRAYASPATLRRL